MAEATKDQLGDALLPALPKNGNAHQIPVNHDNAHPTISVHVKTGLPVMRYLARCGA